MQLYQQIGNEDVEDILTEYVNTRHLEQEQQRGIDVDADVPAAIENIVREHVSSRRREQEQQQRSDVIEEIIIVEDVRPRIGERNIDPFYADVENIVIEHASSGQRHQDQQQARNRIRTNQNGLLLYFDPNIPSPPTIRFQLSPDRHSNNRVMYNFYFILFYLLARLGIEASLMEGTPLLLICTICSVWLLLSLYMRKRNWGRELERRIEELRVLSGQNSAEISFGGEVSHGDFSNLMGVSDEAQSKWSRHTYDEKNKESTTFISNYGSVESKLDVKDVTCSICLCEYEDGEQLITLPCSHNYHEHCIGEWTFNHSTCPQCREIL